MKQRTFLAILLTTIALASFAPSKIGLFEAGKDIGNPKMAGSSAYDPSTKTYIMKSGGYNIWFERDEFQYLFRQMEGDFTVSADFEFVGKGQDAHRKVGWMVRDNAIFKEQYRHWHCSLELIIYLPLSRHSLSLRAV